MATRRARDFDPSEFVKRINESRDLDRILKTVESEAREALRDVAPSIVAYEQYPDGPIFKSPIEWPHPVPDTANDAEKTAAKFLQRLAIFRLHREARNVGAMMFDLFTLGAGAERLGLVGFDLIVNEHKKRRIDAGKQRKIEARHARWRSAARIILEAEPGLSRTAVSKRIATQERRKKIPGPKHWRTISAVIVTEFQK